MSQTLSKSCNVSLKVHPIPLQNMASSEPSNEEFYNNVQPKHALFHIHLPYSDVQCTKVDFRREF